MQERIRDAFEAVKEKLLEAFPGSDVDIEPSRFGIGDGRITVHTNQQGYEERYARLDPLGGFIDGVRKKGIFFGFDVVREAG